MVCFNHAWCLGQTHLSAYGDKKDTLHKLQFLFLFLSLSLLLCPVFLCMRLLCSHMQVGLPPSNSQYIFSTMSEMEEAFHFLTG